VATGLLAFVIVGVVDPSLEISVQIPDSLASAGEFPLKIAEVVVKSQKFWSVVNAPVISEVGGGTVIVMVAVPEAQVPVTVQRKI